jgi:hypothetical protein
VQVTFVPQEENSMILGGASVVAAISLPNSLASTPLSTTDQPSKNETMTS